ncbi:MAG: helix-turn-helix transcriptional regulator [Ignavibacteriales bacterium]|nr:helix-turn-helix transcriptional regulator [Ignavibacteriales bacterium]
MAQYINVVPEVLKSIRLSIGMDLAKISKKTKIPLDDLKSFESTTGKKPSLSELSLLAKAYNKPLAALLLYKPIKKPLQKDRKNC